MRKKNIKLITAIGLVFAASGMLSISALADWQYSGSKWRYESEGDYLTGWQYINGAWYYFNADGSMAHDQWIEDYYVGKNGVMAVNTWIGNYYVGSDGAWVPDYQNEEALYNAYCEQTYGNRVIKTTLVDVTHDGKDDFLVLVSSLYGAYDEIEVLTSENDAVKCIYNKECNFRTYYYLYEQNGLEYILSVYEGIFQGSGSYVFDVFSLQPDGTEVYLDSKSFWVNDASEMERQGKACQKKLIPYINKSQVFFSGQNDI